MSSGNVARRAALQTPVGHFHKVEGPAPFHSRVRGQTSSLSRTLPVPVASRGPSAMYSPRMRWHPRWPSIRYPDQGCSWYAPARRPTSRRSPRPRSCSKSGRPQSTSHPKSGLQSLRVPDCLVCSLSDEGTASSDWNRRDRYGARGRSDTEPLDKADLMPA
jgi:hypothetical protein